jgi:hypothetical protein
MRNACVHRASRQLALFKIDMVLAEVITVHLVKL